MGKSGGSKRLDKEALLAGGRKLVAVESRAVAEIVGLVDETLLEIANEILSRRGKVIVSGVGTSGTVARRMAHLLSVTGTPAVFIHPADANHGSLGAISTGDSVIVISKGGESDEVNLFARRAVERGAYVVGLTHRADTEFTARVQRFVLFPDPGEADLGGIVAMGSTLAVSTWGDVLAFVLKDIRQYGWSEVLNTHPGGAVGKAGMPPSEKTIA